MQMEYVAAIYVWGDRLMSIYSGGDRTVVTLLVAKAQSAERDEGEER